MFAWALGIFSPNIHAARLHFVEWMRQYYDSSGEAFEPFGFRSNFVEVE
jgi:vacuolar-type H+-ATPase subunit I/STV1